MVGAGLRQPLQLLVIQASWTVSHQVIPLVLKDELARGTLVHILLIFIITRFLICIAVTILNKIADCGFWDTLVIATVK